MYIAENEAILRNVLAAYDFPDTPIGVVRYGSGQVTYVEPCSAAYAVFGELQVLSIEITVELPSGQSTVGLSEIYILGSKPLTRANRLRE